jgi:hypothetical protein
MLWIATLFWGKWAVSGCQNFLLCIVFLSFLSSLNDLTAQKQYIYNNFALEAFSALSNSTVVLQ